MAWTSVKLLLILLWESVDNKLTDDGPKSNWKGLLVGQLSINLSF